MLFPQFVAETQETIRGQAGFEPWPASAVPVLAHHQAASSATSGQHSEFPVETWDLRQAGTLLESRIWVRVAPLGKLRCWRQLQWTDYLLSHQHWDSCRLGVGR